MGRLSVFPTCYIVHRHTWINRYAYTNVHRNMLLLLIHTWFHTSHTAILWPQNVPAVFSLFVLRIILLSVRPTSCYHFIVTSYIRSLFNTCKAWPLYTHILTSLVISFINFIIFTKFISVHYWISLLSAPSASSICSPMLNRVFRYLLGFSWHAI